MRYRTDDGRFVYFGGVFVGAARDDFDAGSFVNELNLLRDALRVAWANVKAEQATIEALKNVTAATKGPRDVFESAVTEANACIDRQIAARAASDNNDLIRRVRGEVKG